VLDQIADQIVESKIRKSEDIEKSSKKYKKKHKRKNYSVSSDEVDEDCEYPQSSKRKLTKKSKKEHKVVEQENNSDDDEFYFGDGGYEFYLDSTKRQLNTDSKITKKSKGIKESPEKSSVKDDQDISQSQNSRSSKDIKEDSRKNY